jgi:hypothetical protein
MGHHESGKMAIMADMAQLRPNRLFAVQQQRASLASARFPYLFIFFFSAASMSSISSSAVFLGDVCAVRALLLLLLLLLLALDLQEATGNSSS